MLPGGASPLWPICFPVYASHVLFDLTHYQSQYLRNTRNTRYGWVASPWTGVPVTPSRDFHPARSVKLRMTPLTAVILCSYCPPFSKVHLMEQEKHNDARKAQKGARKSKGNNWVGFFDFLPSEGDREKSKNPTWNDRREWNLK